MTTRLSFLFVPIDAVGNVNPFIGLGQQLVSRGHSVTFAVSNSWKGKLCPLGFIEKFYQDENSESDSVEKWGEMVQAMKPTLAMSSFEKIEHLNVPIFAQFVADVKQNDQNLRQIVAETKPDLILTDFMYNPALSDAGIPWVMLLSPNPLGVATENVPPIYSGYPTTGDRVLWEEYRKRDEEMHGPVFNDYKNWVLEHGGPELKFEGKSFWGIDSPYGNIYMFPQELSYTAYRADPKNWYQFDTFIRYEPENFDVPERLRNLPGKLIYVSLGTIGCYDLELMRKLIGILSKSPHRFIVSKGPLGDNLELADNMWGANRLPQTNLLPVVDLIITHGGNNTITEAFYFGTKVLVLPLFCDQLDAAQRIFETGHGLSFDPNKVTEKELLNGIETLLGDDILKRRMRSISHRIKAANNPGRAADLLEKVASKR